MPLSQESFARIGVLKPDGLGDLVLALPALQALRRAFPTARIELLVHPARAPFAQALRCIDSVQLLSTPWLEPHRRMRGRGALFGDLAAVLRMAGKVRRMGYELVVNLRPDMRDGLLTGLSGARRTLSFAYHGADALLTEPANEPNSEVHESLRLCNLLEQAGIVCGPEAPELPRDPAATRRVLSLLEQRGVDGPYVVLHPIAPLAAKNWPAGRFVELARVLNDRGRRVLWIGTNLEQAAVARLAEQSEGSINLAGALELLDLVELLAQAELFAGVDSGPAHLAGPLAVPTLVVFSGTNLSSRWRPLGERVVVIEHEADCRPCAGRCDKPEPSCLTAISAERVIDAALSMLRLQGAHA